MMTLWKSPRGVLHSLAVIPLQLLGYYVSVAKGLDVDKPRSDIGKEQLMDKELFNPQSSSVSSSRIIYTPSTFARTSLLHLQEVGSLQAVHPQWLAAPIRLRRNSSEASL